MKTFLQLSEMARRTSLPHFYIAALNGLRRNDWSDTLILADYLEESQNNLLAQLIRACHVAVADPLTATQVEEISTSTDNIWHRFEEEAVKRRERREMPYLLDSFSNVMTLTPSLGFSFNVITFYYTRNYMNSETEYYIRWHQFDNHFGMESSVTGFEKRIKPENVDEYILMYCVGVEVNYLRNRI